ncbi:MAG: hypothetical protein AB8H03_28715 [Saprospiraceae bacterium]
MLRYIFAIIFFSSFYNYINGQALKVFEVDTISNQLKEPLPFDEPFIIKIKVDESPIYIDYVEHKGKRNLHRTLEFSTKHNSRIEKLNDKIRISRSRNNRLEKELKSAPTAKEEQRKRKSLNKSERKRGKLVRKREKLLRKQIRSIPFENYEVKKEGKKNFLYITFNKHPYSKYKNPRGKLNDILKPSKEYTLFFAEIHPQAIKIFSLTHNKKKTEVSDLLEKILKSQNNQNGFVYITPSDTTAISKFYQDYLKEYFDQIDSDSKKISEINLTELSKLGKSSLLKPAVKLFSKCDSSKSKIKLCTDCCDLLRTAQNIYGLDMKIQGTSLLKGEIHILDLKSSPKKLNRNIQISNLKKSKQAICNLEEALQTINITNQLIDEETIKQLKIFSNDIGNRIKLLTSINESEVKIKNEIIKYQFFLKPRILGSSTYIYNFKTRTELQVIPDFGYSSFGWIDKNLRNFTPTLGFHIRFRPIKKDIPFKTYPNKTILHRLSFTTSWSLTSIQADGKRENFFSNSTLQTGLGFKIGGGVNLTGGAMWFRKIDPNPLVTDKTLATIPFVGINIDLDVKKFINGFSDLIPSK